MWRMLLGAALRIIYCHIKWRKTKKNHDLDPVSLPLTGQKHLVSKLDQVGEIAAERAKETGASERTLHHKTDQFDQHSMASLFHKESTASPDKTRSLPTRYAPAHRRSEAPNTQAFAHMRLLPFAHLALWLQAL
jgi:hypothetical protein